MSSIKISALAAKTTSAGSEELLINDGGVSKKITIANLRSTSDIKTSVEAATDIALGGSPTTTTQSASDNSTKVATTAYADTAVANLVDSAPATLNTLDELAAALGDDANYAATITTALGTKAALAGATFTGAVTATTFNGTELAHKDDHNLGLGHSAIAAITTGDNNIGVGINALASTTTGGLNIAVGRNALLTNITGGNNTALGGDALRHTTSSNNTGVGYDALEANTSGTENIAVGAFAGDAITTGSNNTIIGHYAGTTALSDTVVIAAGSTERLKVTSAGLDVNGTTAVLTDTDTVYTHPNHSGDVTSTADGATVIAAGAVDIAMLSATGTAGATNFLRGDNTWVVPTDTNTVYTHPNHSGDVTSTADGATVITAGAVDTAMLSATLGDLRGRGITHVGRDTNDYIHIDVAHVRFYINGVNVMSVDASGNAIFKGTVSSNGTPA